MSKWVLESPSAAKPLRTASKQQARLLVVYKAGDFKRNILLLNSSCCVTVLLGGACTCFSETSCQKNYFYDYALGTSIPNVRNIFIHLVYSFGKHEGNREPGLFFSTRSSSE